MEVVKKYMSIISLHKKQKRLSYGAYAPLRQPRLSPLCGCECELIENVCFSTFLVAVIHLLPNNVSITQKDIEDRLIKKFFPNKGQLLLFETGEDLSEKGYIKRAYNKQNAEIGYSYIYSMILILYQSKILSLDCWNI